MNTAPAEWASPPTPETICLPLAAVSAWSNGICRRYQHVLDRSTPHVLYQWLGCLFLALVYVIRVFRPRFYVASHGLGICILNLLIGFVSLQVDLEIHDLSYDAGLILPTRGSNEFRHFVCRAP